MIKMRPNKLPAISKFAMSKPVGKMLNSKVGKVGVKMGNTAMKVASAPFKWAGRQMEKEMRGGEQKWKNLQIKNRKEKTGEY